MTYIHIPDWVTRHGIDPDVYMSEVRQTSKFEAFKKLCPTVRQDLSIAAVAQDREQVEPVDVRRVILARAMQDFKSGKLSPDHFAMVMLDLMNPVESKVDHGFKREERLRVCDLPEDVTS